MLEKQSVCLLCGREVAPAAFSEWTTVETLGQRGAEAGDASTRTEGAVTTPPLPGYTQEATGSTRTEAAAGYMPVKSAADAPAPAYVPVQGGQAAPMPTPAHTRQKSAWPKIIAAVLLVFLLLAAASVAGVVYLVHRAKQKVAELEAQARRGELLRPHSGSAKNAQTPAFKFPGTALDPDVISAPVVAAAPSGDRARDWALQYERTVNGPEADLVVRAGSIDNLGFGWPQGFDPFSGESTPPHSYPWTTKAGVANGTDRIMLGSSVTTGIWRGGSDGYSRILNSCIEFGTPPPPCQARQDSMPRAITLPMGAMPPKIDAVLVQIFVDDFQAPVFKSHFQVSLNGTRIPSFEEAVNVLNQTGPIGKLISLRLLPEYSPLLKSGDAKLLIDDPETQQRDGYAVDFVRVLVNPHSMQYTVSLAAYVVDADKHTPIPGATVTAALISVAADARGHAELKDLPAGLVMASASSPGYDPNSVQADLPAGHSGTAEIPLHRHQEDAASLERAIEATGTATLYGIHFDTGSAKLRPDSLPALEAILGVMEKRPGSSWIIAGHTDNEGSHGKNVPLSQARAGSVIAWLVDHGVAQSQLQAQGFGASRPVADNSTADGRALNRRVEISAGTKQ